MTSLKPYPRYKAAEAEWLGEIPDHWDAPRLKRLATINPSRLDVASLPDDLPVTFLPMEKVSETGRVDRSLSRPIQDVRNGFTYFRDGDVIVAKITPCFENGKAALVDDLDNGVGFGSTEFHVLRSHGQLDRRYLYRVVSSYDFRSLGEASMEGAGGQKRVPTEFVANFTTPLPPLDEQRAIANFLDGMDARITRFIAARRKIIALLEEKKQAVINQAVTRGLDLSVPMKDSGVDWLGEIPAYWDVRRSKYVFREVDYRATDESLPRLSMSQKYGLVPNTDIESWRLQSTSAVGAKIADRDDLVLNRLKAHLAVFAHAPARGTVSPDYTVLRPIPPANVRYFEALYRTPRYRGEFFKRTKGIVEGFWRLYTDAFYDVVVPYPNPAEQQAIVEYINRENARTSALINRHHREIELIQEYRTRLISDVVTGKLDVRGVELPAVEAVIGEEIEAAMESEVDEEEMAWSG